MRSRCASPPKECDVFQNIQNGRDLAAAALGLSVPAGAVLADVLLQLLVDYAGSDHCALVELRQLQRTTAEDRLLANVAALHVDCGARDAFLSASWLSTGMFPVVLCRQAKRPAVSTRHYSALGELSGAGLRVENDP